MTCKIKAGHPCESQTTCSTFFTSDLNLTDWTFRIGLAKNEWNYHAYLPLYAMMREFNSTDAAGYTQSTCQILAYTLDTSNPESDAIILGTPFF